MPAVPAVAVSFCPLNLGMKVSTGARSKQDGDAVAVRCICKFHHFLLHGQERRHCINRALISIPWDTHWIPIQRMWRRDEANLWVWHLAGKHTDHWTPWRTSFEFKSGKTILTLKTEVSTCFEMFQQKTPKKHIEKETKNQENTALRRNFRSLPWSRWSWFVHKLLHVTTKRFRCQRLSDHEPPPMHRLKLSRTWVHHATWHRLSLKQTESYWFILMQSYTYRCTQST